MIADRAVFADEDFDDYEDDEFGDGFQQRTLTLDEGFEISGNFAGDVKDIAQQYIDSFFADKFLHCGNKIPTHLRHSPWRVSLVMNTPIWKAVIYSYGELEKDIPEDTKFQAERLGLVTEDIKLVNDALSLLGRSGIPKCFAGGMLLVYLEFCEGMTLDPSSVARVRSEPEL